MAERRSPRWVDAALAGVPVLLLAAVVYWLVDGGARRWFATGLPPVENLHVLRHHLAPDSIELDVINAGSDAATIAQVIVRGAFWGHDVTPSRRLEPLDTARVTIPYPWNLGEPVDIALLSSTGLTFPYTVEVASVTPAPTVDALLRFALIGVFVGVIPVGIGLTWFPFLRRLGPRAIGFLLYLTVGLLAFLVVDALDEGRDIAKELPDLYHGTALLVLGTAGAFLVLAGLEAQGRSRRSAVGGGLWVATWIAVGIGLHNLGEGLAIGSAYVLGEVSLGALLIVGFTLHNATEGIAIVSPILDRGARLGRLVALGLIAGAPTIVGCWIGAFTYSKVWSVLFLGIGAGAIVQVILAIAGRRSLAEHLAPAHLAGIGTGYLMMYATGALVGAA